MPFSHTIRGERFLFADLRELLAKANEAKSGDELAGIAARSERERVAAKLALADVPLSALAERPVMPSRRGPRATRGSAARRYANTLLTTSPSTSVSRKSRPAWR
jgi:ethanolamine ammonia-lyase large subunit